MAKKCNGSLTKRSLFFFLVMLLVFTVGCSSGESAVSQNEILGTDDAGSSKSDAEQSTAENIHSENSEDEPSLSESEVETTNDSDLDDTAQSQQTSEESQFESNRDIISDDELLAMIDDVFVWKYIDSFLMVMNTFGESGAVATVFENPTTITERELCMFFQMINSFEDDMFQEKWFHKDEMLYRVPVDAVVSTLDQYFEEYNFDLDELKDGDVARGDYAAQGSEILTRIAPGFGGWSPTPLEVYSKEPIGDNAIKLTVGYGSPSKVFVFRLDRSGNVKYLSVLDI